MDIIERGLDKYMGGYHTMKDKIKQEITRLFCTKSQYKDENYKPYLDMVKGIAIFLVVLGHSGTIEHAVNKWLSTFHLPVFFVVSGILIHLKKEEKKPLMHVLKNKIRGILIPYLFFSLGTMFVIAAVVFMGKLEIKILIESVWKTIYLQGYSVMWFLPVLFWAELLIIIQLKILERISNNNMLKVILVCIISTILASISYNYYKGISVNVVSEIILEEIKVFSKAIVAGPFVSYGYFLGMIIEKADRKKNLYHTRKKYQYTELLIGIILFSINIMVLPHIRLMDLNNLNLTGLHGYLLLGAGASIGLILICRNIPNIPIISFYGQNSLIVMCTHLSFYILYIALVIGKFVDAYLSSNYINVKCYVTMICVMMLEIPVIIFVKVFFPFMLGKR